jgi:hypothetical protein
MKRNLIAVALFVAVSIVMQTAGAITCKPVPAKKWTGSLKTTTQSPDVTWNYFSQNKCSWAGHESEFNGVDAVVFEVSKYAKLPGTLTYKQSTTGSVDSVSVSFVDKNCQAILGSFASSTTPGKAVKFTFPAGVKWAQVYGGNGLRVGIDTAVTLASPGKKCPRRR